MSPKKSTPLGVIIIAVLMLIGGIIDIIGGITAILGSPFLPPLFAAETFIIGILVLIWGIIVLMASLALMRLEPWAWSFVIIVNIINVILGIISGNYLTLVISIIVLVYMFYRKEEFK